MLTERQRRYLLFCHAFTDCDTVSAIASHGKSALFDKFCSGNIDKYMDIFLDLQAARMQWLQIVLLFLNLQCTGTTLGETRYNMFAHKPCSSWTDTTRDSTSHRGSSFTTFTAFVPSNQGPDAFAKYVFEPWRIWMDCRESWLWASSYIGPHSPWRVTQIYKLQLLWRLQH